MVMRYFSKSLIYLILTIVIVLTIGSPSFADDIVALTLEDSVKLALKNNTDVLVAKARIKQSEGQKDILLADLLPQIDVGASQQRTWWENLGALGFSGAGSIGPFNTFDSRIAISQRIIDLSALTRAQAGRIKLKSANLTSDLVKEQIMLATAMAYIQTLQYQEQLEASKEDIRLAEHLLSLSEHQLDAGLASIVDVARSKTQLAQHQARQEQLRLNVIKSQIALKRIMKLPLDQTIELKDDLVNKEVVGITAEQAFEKAKEGRIELRLAESNVDYSLTQLKAAKRERLPKVEVGGDFGLQGVTPTDDAQRAAQATVRVTMPIWEGGRIEGAIKEQTGLNDEENLQLTDTKLRIEQDVRLAIETLKSNFIQVQAMQKVVDLAKQELTLAQDRFSSGVGNNTDVIDAETKFASAHDLYVQTLAQYNQAQLNYFAALGNPTEFNLNSPKQEGTK